jgi:hypothetical protein
MRAVRSSLSPARAIVYAGLTVGTLDILDALIFFGARGAAPIRIFQSIAAGVHGRAAFQGGWNTAAQGLGLHYLIAFSIATTYFLASRKIRMLRDQPVWCGFAYGLAVWCVMNFVVLPLSNAGRGPFVLPVVLNGWLIHLFGVGLPSAWFASRVGSASSRASAALA